jgi:ATP-dependent RNA helicase DDX55/SPB4
MPELRDVLLKNRGKLPNFTGAGREVDIYAIPFKDKAREQARKKRQEEELAAGGKNAKLIKAEQRKAERERKQKERREVAIEKGRNPDKKRGKHQQILDDWDDLAKEERLYKKMRRGKISKDEFHERMYAK